MTTLPAKHGKLSGKVVTSPFESSKLSVDKGSLQNDWKENPMKKRTYLTLALSVLMLGALVMTAPLAAQEDDGKAVFEAQKCNICHAVSSAEIEAKTKSEKLKGPDLTGVGDRVEGAWITRYVKKEVDREGKKHMKPFKGTDEELQAIVDWLLEQKPVE